MATTTQAKYDAAVKKYGKAKTDRVMKKNNVTIKKEESKIKKTITPYGEVVAKTGYDIESGGAGRVISVWEASQPGFKGIDDTISKDAAAAKARGEDFDAEAARTPGISSSAKIGSNKLEEARKRAASRARRLKKQYESVSKKAGGSDNLLKFVGKKYGVNSKQYRDTKRKVIKYEGNESTVKEVVKKEKTTAVDAKKGLTKSQYNALLKKYGDSAGVIAAAVAKYGANTSQVKKVKNLLSDYSGIKDVKKIREKTVITDADVRSDEGDFKGIEPSRKTESAIFATKWDSPERQAAAKEFGITNYTGTASQNVLLRKKIREGSKETDSQRDQREKGITPEKQAEADKLSDTDTTQEDTKLTEKKIKANEKNLAALKKLRLSGKTDSDLLKKVEDKYGKDSDEYTKLKNFMKENPLADSTEGIDSGLLEKSKEELDQIQIESLEAARDENIAMTAENFIKGSEVIAGNNKELQTFYKDMAVELKQFIEDNRVRKEAALQRTKDSELNRVVGQIRATLARRGVNIGNIPPEQLIAMSGELGVEAMRRIDEATTEMEDSVSELTERKTAEINKLKEQGLIKQSEADASIEQMRQLNEKMISDIKSNFVANTFKITKASIADKDTNKAETLNTISTFVTQLGISGTAQGVMEDYLESSDSVEALENMIADLNDVNSKLFKAVDDAAKAAQLSAEFKAKIELMKATKSTSSSNSSTTRKIGEATMRALLAEGVPNASGYKTYGELEAAMNANPELKVKITTAISKANAINVSDSDT